MTTDPHPTHERTVCLTSRVLAGEPVHAIDWEPPTRPTDSGYGLRSRPDMDDETLTGDDVHAMCLGCLIDTQPAHVGAGLDMAQRSPHGLVLWDDVRQVWDGTDPDTT